ncbi:hypothetical protein [Streptomyces sp. CoT10]|uniref:hypothetical protein n=1 Tax=Streptomyces sp. CoT10 TaxID=2875762 RepID=UPI001CD3D3B9|nr:hypothetical protein [Streptomyces sp. CoT10]
MPHRNHKGGLLGMGLDRSVASTNRRSDLAVLAEPAAFLDPGWPFLAGTFQRNVWPAPSV